MFLDLIADSTGKENRSTGQPVIVEDCFADAILDDELLMNDYKSHTSVIGTKENT